MSLRLAAYGMQEVFDSTGKMVKVYLPVSYVIYEANESISSTGQTAAFNWWRDQLSVYMLGTTTETIKNHAEEYLSQPFFEIITYPDSNGTFGWQVCRKLAGDFMNPVYMARALSADSTGTSGFKAGYEKWRAAFVYAATNNGYITFGKAADSEVPQLLTESPSGFRVPVPVSNDDQVRLRERMRNQARILAPKSEILSAPPLINPLVPVSPLTESYAPQITGVVLPTQPVVNLTPLEPVNLVQPVVSAQPLEITPPVVPNKEVAAEPVPAPVPLAPLVAPLGGEVIPLAGSKLTLPETVEAVGTPVAAGEALLAGDIINIKFGSGSAVRNLVGTVLGYTANGDLRVQTPTGNVVLAKSEQTLQAISLVHRMGRR
jgi:hypothetical protein